MGKLENDTDGGWFWSGAAEADGYAWGMDFDRGQAIPYQMSAFSSVRLVRPAPQGGDQRTQAAP